MVNSPAWSRKIELRRATGLVVDVWLEIGTPVLEETGEWSCEVGARGLFHRLAPQRGVDSFQAGLLALRLLHSLIDAEIDMGSEVHWLGETVTAEALFS